MDLLNAALAFAVLMITLSTAATALSEAFLRISSQRPRVLAGALLQFIKTDPRIKTAMEKILDEDVTFRAISRWLDEAENAAGETADAAKRKLTQAIGAFSDVDEMKAAFAAYRQAELDKLAEKARLKLVTNPAQASEPEAFSASKSIDTLTTFAFVQRLAETDIGKSLGKRVEADTLKALTRGFERFTAASNELFRKRARTATMISAIILAFSVNIPAGPVFDYVMENPELAGAIAADAQTAIESNQQQLDDFDKALSELTLDADKVPELDLTEDEAARLQKASEEVSSAVDDISSTLENARGLYELPLGYQASWFEDTCGGFDPPLTQAEDPSSLDNISYAVRLGWFGAGECISSGAFRFWFVNVLLSGVLIGLGGPFWYRVYASLSHTAQLVRAFRGSTRPETLGTGSSTNQPIHASIAHGVDTTEGEETDGADTTTSAAPAQAPKKADVDDQLMRLFQVSLSGT